MEEGRNQFTFYRSYCEAIEQMKPADQLAVLRAIMYYALDNKEPEKLNAAQRSVFVLIRPVLETGRKRAVSGRIGGSKPKANKKQTPREKEKEGEIEKEGDIEDECLKGTPVFENFWKAFPLQVGKAKAIAIWDSMQPNYEAVMEGLQRWKDSQEWEREDGRFIPRPWRWLAQQLYLDHPTPRSKPIYGATGALGKAELEAIARVMQEDDTERM